jgi:hypothetical protein
MDAIGNDRGSKLSEGWRATIWRRHSVFLRLGSGTSVCRKVALDRKRIALAELLGADLRLAAPDEHAMPIGGPFLGLSPSPLAVAIKPASIGRDA